MRKRPKWEAPEIVSWPSPEGWTFYDTARCGTCSPAIPSKPKKKKCSPKTCNPAVCRVPDWSCGPESCNPYFWFYPIGHCQPRYF